MWRPSPSWSGSGPTSDPRTSPGCSCSRPTGRSSPTSPSPTSCCGCATGRTTGSGPVRRCGPPPVRPPTSTTSSAPTCRPDGGPCSTRRGRRSGSCARATPSGATRCRCAARRSRWCAPGRVIGVVARHTNLLGVRTPSRLELSYLQTAADLTTMIATGEFPAPGQRSDHADSPRVGDGFLRVDADGRVVYASPNAQSVFRRLGLSGDLAGQLLPDLTRDLVPARRRPDEETLSAVLGGRAHRDVEIATDEAALIVRAIPLRPDGHPPGRADPGARRHRAASPRPRAGHQGRHDPRDPPPGEEQPPDRGRAAASPGAPHRQRGGEGGPRGGGAPGRVDRDRARDAEPGGRGDGRLRRDRRPARGDGHRGQRAHRSGRRAAHGPFGVLPSESANALAMVLTELLQNAVEHGYADDESRARRPDLGRASTGSSAACTSPSTTTAAACPEGFTLDGSTNLGLSIVRTLVESELGGQLDVTARPGGGTRVVVDVPLGG